MKSSTPRPANREIHVLFDLDDTLYPASTGLFRLVATRIHRFICDELELDSEAARKLQRHYWQQYGTSLYGLMLHHDVDPEPFLEFVHDVPVEDHLSANPELRSVLEALPVHKHIFTNGPTPYVERVLHALGIDDQFVEIFDIRRAGYVPKPNPQPYDRVMEWIGDDRARCVLIEDAAKNLPPAVERGWRTVWLRSPQSWLGGAPGLSSAGLTDIRSDAVVEKIEDLGPVLTRLLEFRDGPASL